MDYRYKAVVRSVYDGDTIRVDIDLGFNTWIRNTSLRLYGINTPEIRGDERDAGLISKAYVEERLPVGKEIVIESFKDRTGKYGRYLATIFYDGANLNEELVEAGLAEVAMY